MIYLLAVSKTIAAANITAKVIFNLTSSVQEFAVTVKIDTKIAIIRWLDEGQRCQTKF